MPATTTIIEIDRLQVFDPRLYPPEDSYFKSIKKSVRYATAPYTIHLLDGAYVAINRCLQVKAEFADGRDHKITFTDPYPPPGIEEVIKYAFSVFRATHRYDLIISDIYDHEGNAAYTALIACLLHLVMKFEEMAVREYTIDQWIFRVLYKFDIAPESPKAIRQAVLHGGNNVAYFEPAEGKEMIDRTMPDNFFLYLSFSMDYDVYFVRTNLHPWNFQKSLKPDRNRMNYLNKNFKKTLEYATCMTEYSKIRMTDEDCSDLQRECDAAIQDYLDENENGPTIHGHESQRGGLLLVAPKNSFANEEFLGTLACKLAENCSDEVAHVSFEHFFPGPAVRIMEPVEDTKKKKVNKIVFHLETIREPDLDQKPMLKLENLRI